MGLPKRFGTIDDKEYFLKITESKDGIESIYLPKDQSAMKALRGWAVVTLSEDIKQKYSSWISKNITLEGRKLKFYDNKMLLDLISSSKDQGKSDSNLIPTLINSML